MKEDSITAISATLSSVESALAVIPASFPTKALEVDLMEGLVSAASQREFAMPSKEASATVELLASSVTAMGVDSVVLVVARRTEFALLSREANATGATLANSAMVMLEAEEETMVHSDLHACALLSRRASVIVELLASSVMVMRVRPVVGLAV